MDGSYRTDRRRKAKMAEGDEARNSNLESRLAKIEGYIKCKEETEERQWKDNLDKKLKNIADTQIRTAWQWPFSLGASAMASGLTWVIATVPRTPGDFKSGLFVFSVGLAIVVLSLFYRYRKKS